MIGQFANNYILFLLNKYGNEWKKEEFYAKLYFKAFPDLYDKDKESSEDFFSIRTFHRLFLWFGFIEYKDNDIYKGIIRTTEIFKKYIKIEMYCA